MSETTIVRAIRLTLEARGVWVKRHNGGTRNHRQMGLGPGTPDLHVLFRGQAYWLEVKQPGEKPRADQVEWMRDAVQRGGAVCAVVTTVTEALRVLGIVANDNQIATRQKAG